MNALRLLVKIFLMSIWVIIGLTCSLGAYTSYKKVADLKTWKPAGAIVTSSIVTKERSRKGTSYCPEVNVRYEFEEIILTSELDIKDGPCSLTEASARKTVVKYKAGTAVDTFINPNKPSEIRVATYTLGMFFYLMMVAIISVAIGFALMWRVPSNMLFNRGAKKTKLA